MMKKTIIASDLDGTLLKDDKTISNYTKQLITEFIKRGNYFVICSGRPTFRTTYLEQELGLNQYPQYVINYNGGIIRKADTNEIIFKACLTDVDKDNLIKHAINHNLHLMVYDENHIYIDEVPNHSLYLNEIEELVICNKEDLFKVNNVIKIIYLVEPSTIQNVKKNIPDSFKEQFNFFQSSEYYYEITPKVVSKGLSLMRLAKHLNISKENVYACGDEGNDLSMILEAGTSVVVANGTSELKQYADIITSSNEEDGVGKIIESVLLKDENTCK